MQWKLSLKSLKHPNKPNITAVKSYAVLPDVGIWANQYDLFKFYERPGERPVDVCPFFPYTLTSLILILYINQVDDPRLDCAILRPMKTEHDSFLAFNLTEDNEQALKFKETRFDLPPYEVPESEEVSNHVYTP